ncbi:FecR family protein [Pontibacter litorisediminis]|uniref:FecR family protein n=1 Tax=Pontibacter litorisediminis TaxID=1846260 RepID=UPI0023EADF62|nr:FecR domain-containing protein [Pontibacter litorisediminis]
MKYQNYRASDFAADEDFIQWVQQPTEATDALWGAFLQEHPWQRAAVKEARELVQCLSEDPWPAADTALDEVWEQLTAARQRDAEEGEESAVVVALKPAGPQKYALLWAAAVALLFVCSFLLFLQQEKTITYATAAGERMHLRLPDSSTVVLNNNSRLTIPAKWAKDKERIVQLEGHAFFSVTHKHNNQKFVVKTADGLAVEVLGTEFSVSSKGNQQQVILERGKVRLRVPGEGEEQQLEMQPGELVEVTEEKDIIKKKVNPALYTAWKNTGLALENITLEEVGQMLQHSYGYSVTITDPALKQQRITAYLDSNTPSHILSTVSETLQVEVQIQRESITISSN